MDSFNQPFLYCAHHINVITPKLLIEQAKEEVVRMCTRSQETFKQRQSDNFEALVSNSFYRDPSMHCVMCVCLFDCLFEGHYSVIEEYKEEEEKG